MLAVIGAYLSAFCAVNFDGFARFCTGDMYEDTYIARLFWEQKTVFPDNWVFGNQYYVVTTPVLAALFYGMGLSLNTAMAAATTVMTVLILVSLFWMLKPFARWHECLFGCAMMLSVVAGPYIVDTTEGQIFYLMCSYYAAYLVTLFVVFGAYARCLRGCSYRAFVPMAAVSAVLSFCTGMQSLRQTAVMVLPMVLYELGRWLPRVPQVLDTLHTLRERQNTRPLKRDMLHRLSREKGTMLALVSCIANLLGYGVVKLIDPRSVTIYGDIQGQTVLERQENLKTAIRGLQNITGLKYLGAEEWNGVIGGFCLLLIVVAVVAMVLRNRERDRKEGIFVYLDLCLLSLLSVLVISVVTAVSLRSIYFFVWYALAAVAGVLVFRLARRNAKLLFAALMTVLMVVNLRVSYGECVRDARSQEKTLEAETAEWIVDHGYTVAYGEWNAVTKVAAWTDGKVAAGAWSWTDKLFRPLEYINPLDIYTEADNARAVHILTPETLEVSMNHASLHDAQLTEVARFTSEPPDEDGEPQAYILCVSDKQLMEFTSRYRPNYSKRGGEPPEKAAPNPLGEREEQTQQA